MKKKSSKAKREKISGAERHRTCREKEAQIFRRKSEVAGEEKQRRNCRNRKKTRETKTDK